MLRALRDLYDMSVATRGTAVGKVMDVYCDERNWTVRYVVIDTHNRLAVRIAPPSIQTVDWNASRIDLEQPLDQLLENQPTGGVAPNPKRLCRSGGDDPSLRSAADIAGYHVNALNGAIGIIEDVLMDDDSWSIRYFLVAACHFSPGDHVLIHTDRVSCIRSAQSTMQVSTTIDPTQGSQQRQLRAVIPTTRLC